MNSVEAEEQVKRSRVDKDEYWNSKHKDALHLVLRDVYPRVCSFFRKQRGDISLVEIYLTEELEWLGIVNSVVYIDNFGVWVSDGDGHGQEDYVWRPKLILWKYIRGIECDTVS